MSLTKPLTREEFYYAYLAGNKNIKLPAPITREEKFLYARCMAEDKDVRSWNDLADKPFGEEAGYRTIAAETTIESDNTITVSENLVSGDIYLVVYDGVNYECTAGYEYITGNLCIGNKSIVYNGGSNVDTGEPFAIADNGGRWYFSFSEGGSHTISIKQYGTVINQIDEKYIPDIIVRKSELPESEIFIVQASSGTPECSFEELEAARNAGKIIYLRYQGGALKPLVGVVVENSLTVYRWIDYMMPCTLYDENNSYAEVTGMRISIASWTQNTDSIVSEDCYLSNTFATLNVGS